MKINGWAVRIGEERAVHLWQLSLIMKRDGERFAGAGRYRLASPPHRDERTAPSRRDLMLRRRCFPLLLLALALLALTSLAPGVPAAQAVDPASPGAWTRLPPPAPAPPDRHYGGLVYDSAAGAIRLF